MVEEDSEKCLQEGEHELLVVETCSGGRSARFRVEAARREAESTPVEAPPPTPTSPDTSAVIPQGNLGLQGIDVTSGGASYHDSTSPLANQEVF